MDWLSSVLWLPWEAEKHSHEVAAYHWVNELQRLVNVALDQAEMVVHIEGTGALFDDFFSINAGSMSQIQHLARQNRLWVGPWYAPPAEMLASGETLVRNLLLGAAAACQLGLAGQTAYLFPARFHIAQMPQVLAGFGIKAVAIPFLVHNSDTVERFSQVAAGFGYQAFRWQGSAESAIICVPLPVAAPSAWAGGNALSYTSLEVLLLQQRSNLPVATGEWQECQTEPTNSVVSTWGGTGEPNGITPAYASAWPHLRHTMWEAQALLEKWAEPWAAAAWLYGESYPEQFLGRAWRHVLLNHRRDAAGGCYNDTTHNHMLVRAERAGSLAEAICRNSIAAVAKHAPAPKRSSLHPVRAESSEATVLWAVNPLGWSRSEVVTTQVAMPVGTRYIELATTNGTALPYQLHHAEPTPIQAAHDGNQARRFTISFRVADVPPTGFMQLQALPTAHRPYFMGESIAAGNTLENKLLRVTVKNNGALRIEDKRTGRVYDNCNVFEDGGDAGTTTTFVPPEQDRLITTYAAHAHVSIVENGMLAGTIQVQHELSLAAELHPYRDRRSEQRVNCDIVSLVTLRQGSDRVEIHTQVVNRAQDHRLRVLFTTGIAASVCHVAQPFAVVERSTGLLDPGKVLPEWGAFPKLEFVDISDKRHGLLVVSRGIYEYEVKPTPAGTIALTLFRALSPATGHESAVAHTNNLEFDYALIPHASGWEEGARSAWEFCSPLRVFSAVDLGLSGHSTLPGPTSFSLLSLAPEQLVLSAIKRSEDGQALVVRAYNPTRRNLVARFTTSLPLNAAWLARLDETALSPVPIATPNAVSVPCGPGEIITLRLAVAQPSCEIQA